jgi:hypothetical protein
VIYLNFEFESDSVADKMGSDLCARLSVDVKANGDQIESVVIYNKDDDMKLIDINDLHEYEQDRLMDKALYELDMRSQKEDPSDSLYELARDLALLQSPGEEVP